MQPRFLILETSHRLGKVALALGDAVLAERTLDESRRHARDLAPAIQDLLRELAWRARELDGVIVSRGPGSYTGLRVGLMSAKTLAYVTGCVLLAVDTFEAIHALTPKEYTCVDVIDDAQQDKIYVQRFGPQPEPLTIVALDTWLARIQQRTDAVVTGPGLEKYAARMPSSIQVLPRETWCPQTLGLLRIAHQRFVNGERDDPFIVEPLYLRPSSAEEKWQSRQAPP